MFRKPRDLPALVASEDPIRLGRPPTPPSSTDHPKAPRTDTSTTYNMATSTPLVGKTKPGQRRTPFTANGSAAKARGKTNSNGNIMNFFKKAEATGINVKTSKEDESSLFLDEHFVIKEDQTPMQTPTPPRDEESPRDGSIVREESPMSRYNEDIVPVKRLRIEEVADSRLENGRALQGPRKGPFADDSDSENEDLRPLDIMKPVLKIPPDYSEAKISEPATTSATNPHPVEQEYLPPLLKREATSMNRDNDFEGMGDFIDDEFPEEGEEFMERRWMEEQGELEIGLEDDGTDAGAADTAKEDPRELLDPMPQNSESESCPICGGSTAGMAEEVSRDKLQE